MDNLLPIPDKNTVPEFLSGGEMGQRIREFDWVKTSLGSVTYWPQSLRSAISICLNSNFPIAIYWGHDLTLIYNDAWSPIPGDKHPNALGKPAKEVWPEIWKDIEPQFQKAFNGIPGGSKNALLPMHRHGYTEECYFDFTFTPVYGEGGKVEGVFNAVIETTQTILNERQLRTLRELGNLDMTSKTLDEVMIATADVLKVNNKDFPFGIIYKIDTETNSAFPVAYAGVEKDQTVFPTVIDLRKPSADTANFYKAFHTNQIVISENNQRRKNLPLGGWDAEATHFIHLPFTNQNSKVPVAVFSAALNPYRRFDEFYQQFAQLIADQVSTEVTNVLMYEEERKQAKALAEIDKAKTAFFTNISHEFRTPLTLMLGSLEDLLNRPTVATNDKETVETAHRNSVRLLRLVNNLLDFSRIEAGKATARFVLVDIGTFTADIASSFRSAMEAAGLEFTVQTNPITEPVYVDKEMWEKIVLNLLSNAFKYTLQGSVSVLLTNEHNKIVLKVKDTGIGIPEEELPKMFQRFHRIENLTGRSFEGTGIGLSLVNELVKLQGGAISVTSKVGVGSEFTVTLPSGKAHLPQTQIVDTKTAFPTSLTTAFIEDAQALIEIPRLAANQKQTGKEKSLPTILVVDDNADMRVYIKNLLQEDYLVITATNGSEALQTIETLLPALVVSDVMMPVMDGIQLLERIKSNPKTRNLPVLLLSARAGEEARIEGFDLGADDYLIKPFSAKELLARVKSQLAIAQKRERALQDVYHLFDEVPFAVAMLKGKELQIEYINQYNLNIWKRTKEEVLGKPLFEARPDIREDAEPIHAEVYRTGKRFAATELPLQLTIENKKQTRYFNTIIDPLADEHGEVFGQLATTIDVTDQVLARTKAEESEKELYNFLMQVPVSIAVLEGPSHVFILANEGYQKMFDRTNAQLLGRSVKQVFPESEGQSFHQLLNDVYTSGDPVSISELETTLNIRKHTTPRYYDCVFQPIKNRAGEKNRIMVIVIDVTEKVQDRKKVEESETRYRKLAEALETIVSERTKELQRSNEDLQQFAHVASHDLKEPVRKVMTFSNRLKEELGVNLSEKASTYLSKIESSSIRMYSMIDGVLLYSSLNAMDQTKELIDLNELLQSIESDLEVSISDKQAKLVYASLPTVEGSSILIHQLFYNLINNSLKFAKTSLPPAIWVTAENATASDINGLNLPTSKTYVKITVQDNGIGFNNQAAEKIFGTFTRLHAKDKYEGTGLGLALCRKIVERHGGAIYADGTEGEGAAFVFLLPH